MECAFEERILSHLHLAADEWLRQEETADMIVPDSSPDAEQILDSYAVCTVRSVECRTGSVLISGGVQAGVIYLAQEETAPRVLESYLPFSIKKDLEGSTEDARAVVCCRAAGVDARILNSRKLMLRLDLGCALQLYVPRELAVYAPPEDNPRLQLHRQAYSVTLPVEAAQKHFAIQEELDLPAGRPALQKLLRYDLQPVLTESRLAGGRVVFKGELTLELVYLTQDGGVERWQTQLPFSQFVDLAGTYDDEPLRLELQCAGSDVTWEEGRLCLDMMYLVQAVIYAPQQLELVDDAYYLQGSLQARTAPCSLRCLLDTQQQSLPVRLSAAGTLRQVLDARTFLGRAEITWHSGAATIRVPVTARLWGVGEEGRLTSISGSGWAELTQNASPDSQCCVTAACMGEVYAMPGPSGMEVRVNVALTARWHALCNYESISAVTVQEDSGSRERPSVIVRKLTQDTPLWELAKSCGTTCSQIRSANEIRGDVASAGSLLLLPLA